jgi:homoserine dehydrogenase
VMNVPLSKDEVSCQGITELTLDDINKAKSEGKRWKLLAQIKKEENKIVASIKPETVLLTDPLASVMGATNAVTYTCDLAGDITLIGAGAGRTETGFSLLIDLINIVRGQM